MDFNKSVYFFRKKTESFSISMLLDEIGISPGKYLLLLYDVERTGTVQSGVNYPAYANTINVTQTGMTNGELCNFFPKSNQHT